MSVGRAIPEDMDGSGSCPMSTTGPCLAVSELWGYPAGRTLSSHQADPLSCGRAERRVWPKCLGFLENAPPRQFCSWGITPLPFTPSPPVSPHTLEVSGTVGLCHRWPVHPQVTAKETHWADGWGGHCRYPSGTPRY